jgi:hypothetical protein
MAWAWRACPYEIKVSIVRLQILDGIPNNDLIIWIAGLVDLGYLRTEFHGSYLVIASP